MSATLIIVNGQVLTMDESRPRAEAVAMAGNRILAVGNNRDLRALAGAGCKEIDAAGGTVMPGFIESHMHIFAGAAEFGHLQLFGVRGAEALAAKVKDFVAAHPGNDLVIGNQADYVMLSETASVTRHDLDRILPDRPMLLISPDHHTAWANTIALQRAGILKGRALGPGNEIVMGADGLAAGELREGQAMDPVRVLSSESERPGLGLTTGGEPDMPPSPAEFESDLALMQRGLLHCARHGITSFHNMDGNYYQLELLAELERRGQLTARARIPFHFKNFMDIAMLEKASAMAAKYRGEMLCSGFVKLFMDGVIDSGTGYMAADYSDRPGWRSEPLFSAEFFNRIAIEADRRGLQIAVHAIGDGAVNQVLNGYEAARSANGARDSRHRVEHIEVVLPTDIPRFAAMGVIASMQPPHPPGSQGLPLDPYLSRIGRNRWPYAFAWKALREAGARICFASDWPVSDIDPIRSLQSAMTRQRWSGDLPDNRQSLDQALRSYTVDGAYADFMESRKGKLREGMLADAVVLSGDLARTDPEALHEVRTVTTICDGRVVWQA